jgi:hypothetical protein
VIADHVAACKRDGFARVPGVFTRDEVNRLRAEAILACRGGNIEVRDGYPCLLFWPQSTYMRALAQDRRLLDVRLLAKAGDVLTWSNTVVHGSEPNKSDQARGYFMNGFRARSLAEC